jgi:hypothetical protein
VVYLFSLFLEECWPEEPHLHLLDLLVDLEFLVQELMQNQMLGHWVQHLVLELLLKAEFELDQLFLLVVLMKY